MSEIFDDKIKEAIARLQWLTSNKEQKQIIWDVLNDIHLQYNNDMAYMESKLIMAHTETEELRGKGWTPFTDLVNKNKLLAQQLEDALVKVVVPKPCATEDLGTLTLAEITSVLTTLVEALAKRGPKIVTPIFVGRHILMGEPRSRYKCIMCGHAFTIIDSLRAATTKCPSCEIEFYWD